MLGRGLVTAVLPALLVGALAGCGTGSGGSAGNATAPDDAALACRAQWRDLGDALHGRDSQADPSDLTERWSAVLATVDHYEENAVAKDCAAGTGTLAEQQATVRRIEALSARLREFDVAYRMSSLAPVATDYVLGPLPAPRGSGRHRQRPPAKQAVEDALTTLQQQAAASAADMQDGWDEADDVDMTNDPEVRRTLADLRFLAGDSAPFQACLAALAVLQRAATFRTSS